jgi:large subunit ribosomal protein L10
MKKTEKAAVVEELVGRLQGSETMLVADFRGLTMKELDGLRGKLLEHGATFTVVKNTLGRRAASEAGADALLALLEGPTAIAFVESGGDAVAVAKALNETARTTRILQIKGGVLQGVTIDAEQIKELATLPPLDVLRGQVLGNIVAPLTTFVGLVSAPLTDLVGLIDARIAQLQAEGDTSAAAASAPAEAPAAELPAAAEETPVPEPEPEAGAEVAEHEPEAPAAEAAGEPVAEAEAEAEPAAEAEATNPEESE